MDDDRIAQGAKDQLLGRDQERGELDRLLREVRERRSRVLVLRGEAGIGKSELLDYLATQATRMQIVHAAGVEAESDFAYSGVQRICAPLLSHVDRLPHVQQEALRVAFGLSAGKPPELLLAGLAVLGLFSEAAAESPLLCLIDDAQWLDLMSQRILAFVGRRLEAESVALVFAERVTNADGATASGADLDGLPALHVHGLSEADARTLLDSEFPGLVDNRVRDRIVAETGGNPLALLELPRGLSPAELAFGIGGPGAVPLASRVENEFRRRLDVLPADTYTFLLTAAVEPVGDELLLGRAAELLGIGPAAAEQAVAAGLLKLGSPVRFRHPLVRSAVWHSADPATLLTVHRALAQATDAQRDPDRHAWHLGHAAVGPDEQTACALERSAERAMARGGRSAAATFLERAAALTPEPDERARRALAAASAHLAAGTPVRVLDLLAAAELGPLDNRQQAEAARLQAMASYMAEPGLGAVQPLLDATAKLRDLDPAAARQTCLSAVAAAMWAGRLHPYSARRTVEVARSLPLSEDTAGAFLHAYIAWSTEGLSAAGPFLRRMLETADEDPDALWLAIGAAVELGDLQAWLDVTERAVAVARSTGALSIIPTTATFQIIALIHAGRLSETVALMAQTTAAEEAMALSASTIAPAMLSAYRGQERPALDLIEDLEHEGENRGLGRLLSTAGYARAVLYNGLGNHPLALAASRRALEYQDFALHRWALIEVVEAAARTGELTTAFEARKQLSDWAQTGTPWAQGAYALADAIVGSVDGTSTSEATDRRYREAVDHFERGGVGVLHTRSRLLYGEWLRRRHKRAQARAELHAAYKAATTMGMEAFAERTRRELLATGETVSKPTGTAAVLTPQESQISRLVAAGYSNAEVGAQLFLSPRTVEWHLRKIFVKLGISSRRELQRHGIGPEIPGNPNE